jgi:hypothetical protein
MATHKTNRIFFWVFTLLFLLPTAGSGIFELFTSGPDQVVQAFKLLGYPLYLLKILGFAKLMGALAILTGKLPRMKEWAYAGYSFLFLGATASHLLSGDYAHAPIPLAVFAVMLVSYYFSKKIYPAYSASAPRVQSARQPYVNPSKPQWNPSAGSVHFTLEKKSSSSFDLSVRNNGIVDIKEVTFTTTPYDRSPMPSISQKPTKPFPILRQRDKVTIGKGHYEPSKGISFVIEAFWKDPSGRKQSLKKTMVYK